MTAGAASAKDSGSVKAGHLSFGLSLFLAAIGGLFQTLSWPQPGWWPLCLICVTFLILAAAGQCARRGFVLGWVYGLSLGLSSLPWLADVLAGYGGLGTALGWLILFLLAAFLALFKALFGWLITWRSKPAGLWVLMGATAWCGLDWLQNWVFTGFNWTPLAGPLVLSRELGQAASLVGFYGLGFFVALINFCLALAWLEHRRDRKTWLRPVTVGLVMLAAGFIFGHGQYGYWENVAANSPARPVSVVQPCTDQVHKWDRMYRQQLMIHFNDLTNQALIHKPWFVLWPETAMPFIFDYDYEESEWLRRLSGRSESYILAGVTGLSGFWPEQKLNNRMILLDKGEPVAYYDKMHLVPFGEYLPLDWLPFLKWTFMQGLIGAAGTYRSGEPVEAIEITLDPASGTVGEKVRLGIMICFESTFPYIGRRRVLEGAELLIVPTNDGWFGRSRAPEQHLWQSAMRAIEVRRPLVRAGNTGISGVIHPSGRIAGSSQLYEVGAFVFQLPILTGPNLTETFFVRVGYLLAPGTAAITVCLLFPGFLVRRVRQRASAKTRGKNPR